MAKTFEQLISRFDGGITTKLRSGDLRFSSLVANFDIFSDPNRLLAHRALTDDNFGEIAGDDTAANAKICKYVAAGTSSASEVTLLYGLGVKTGTAFAEIFKRSLPIGNWTQCTTAQDSVARDENVFVAYKAAASAGTALYGWSRVDGTNARIWSYDIGSNTFTSSAYTGTGTLAGANTTFGGVVQGIVHSKDDCMYLPYNTANGSYLVKYDNSTWTEKALTLPPNYYITAICEYGNFIAIAVRPRYAGSQSWVYLWTRDTSSSATSVLEKINWGNEELFLIEELNGYLIGISTLGNNANWTYNGLITGPKLVIKSYGGGLVGTKIEKEILLSSGDVVITSKQKANGTLYFMMSASIAGAHYDGIWQFGLTSVGTWALAIDRQLNNGTAITTPVIKDFILLGDKLYAAYTENGTYVAERTASSSVYNIAHLYETTIINNGDASITKKLAGVEVIYEPLPYDATVTLKYKKDYDIDTSGGYGSSYGLAGWTTIFTHTAVDVENIVVGKKYRIASAGDTDFTLIGASESTAEFLFTATGAGTGTGTAITDLLSHSAINIESTGVTLPEYKEIVFRIETTNNVVITGIKLRYEIIDKSFHNYL